MTELRPLDSSPEGLELIYQLLHRVFPHAVHFSPQYLDWLYNRNPAGPGLGMNAFADGTLIGHWASIPYRITLFGKAATVALIVNLAVETRERGARLIEQLGRATIDQGRESGVDAFIGIANDASTRAAGAPLGFQTVCRLDARAGFGPIPAPREEPSVDFEYTHSRDFMTWRIANPSVQYRMRTAGDTAEVLAEAGRPTMLASLGTIDADLAPANAPRALRWRPRVWLGRDPRRAWTTSLYWNLPRRLRPVPLNFLFLDITGADRQLDPDRVRFEGLDFDAY